MVAVVVMVLLGSSRYPSKGGVTGWDEAMFRAVFECLWIESDGNTEKAIVSRRTGSRFVKLEAYDDYCGEHVAKDNAC